MKDLRLIRERKTAHYFEGGHKHGEKVLISKSINIVWTLDKSEKPYKIVKYRNMGNGRLLLIEDESFEYVRF